MEFRWIEWNCLKVASHGVSVAEAEHLVRTARAPYPLYREDDKLLVWGPTRAGRLLQVVYLLDAADVVFIIHARPLTNAEKRRYRRLLRRRGKR